MEYPRVYGAPKVENLASKTDVAWGVCSPAGAAPSATTCGYNGVIADSCSDAGISAGSTCNYPGAAP